MIELIPIEIIKGLNENKSKDYTPDIKYDGNAIKNIRNGNNTYSKDRANRIVDLDELD